MTENADTCGLSLPVALTVAGSDSGGGAGIQADLKTFAAHGVFGTCAVTCVTAQNPDRVAGVQPVDADMVSLQIRTVCEAFPVAAAKTGMLYSAPVVEAVADALRERTAFPLVVDPVMMASSGASLLRGDARQALRERLLPLAAVATPNLDEAAVLCGFAIDSREAMDKAARHIGERFGTACVVKGGHLRAGHRQRSGSGEGTSETVVDVLYAGGKTFAFETPRVRGAETHGTGCTFSAAVTASLAHGRSLEDAVADAQRYVAGALRAAARAGAHRPLDPLAVGRRAERF